MSQTGGGVNASVPLIRAPRSLEVTAIYANALGTEERGEPPPAEWTGR